MYMRGDPQKWAAHAIADLEAIVTLGPDRPIAAPPELLGLDDMVGQLGLACAPLLAGLRDLDVQLGLDRLHAHARERLLDLPARDLDRRLAAHLRAEINEMQAVEGRGELLEGLLEILLGQVVFVDVLDILLAEIEQDLAGLGGVVRVGHTRGREGGKSENEQSGGAGRVFHAHVRVGLAAGDDARSIVPDLGDAASG